MTIYNTGNPVGSMDPRDLLDNSQNLDHFMLSPSRTFPDRLGQQRLTLSALEKATPDAVLARDRAEAASSLAQMVGGATPYVTKAAMDAAAPAQTTWAVVLSDPDPKNNGYYVWRDGAWAWSALQPTSAAEARDWFISLGTRNVIVDAANNKAMYPSIGYFVQGRQGYKLFNPADYGLAYFELPLVDAGNPTLAVQHYIDLDETAPGVSPLKFYLGAVTGLTPPGRKPVIATTWYGQYCPHFDSKGVTYAGRNDPAEQITSAGSIIYDSVNAYGGGADEIYFPSSLYVSSAVRRVAERVTLENPPASPVSVDHVKVVPPVSASGAAWQAAIVATETGKQLVTAPYDGQFQTKKGWFLPVLSSWRRRPTSMSGLPVVDTAVGTVRNQFRHSKGDDLLQAPSIHGSTSIVDVVAPELVALGLTKGFTAAAGRPYVGAAFDEYVPGGRMFVRVYVIAPDADSLPAAARAFVWNASTFIQTLAIPLAAKLAPNIARYEAVFEALDDPAAIRYLVGTETPAGKSGLVCTGVQLHLSRDYSTQRCHIKDYPRPNSGAESSSDDAVALALSAARQAVDVSGIQRPTAKYNAKIVYGQSLARGNETWPALSTQQRFGNLTLGENVFPSNSAGSTYEPFGAATLQPLVAQTVDGATKYSAAQEASLASLAPQATGEPVNHGWANFAKRLHNELSLVDNDESKLFVSLNPAVSGRTIEQLSKGSAEGHYGRYTDALAKLKLASGADQVVVDGVCWMQGEFNYYDNGGGNSYDKATYKVLFDKLITDMQADAIQATGQQSPPAVLTYQTGATYTRDSDSSGVPGLHVGMAQLEVALARRDTFMVGPIYPYTDKGGHLDSNGSRWFGNQVAKVWHHVVRKGKRWLPLMPISIKVTGAREITLAFHVPVPPLRFDVPYVINAATNYPSKGFKVTDALGVLGITAVQVVGAASVRLTLSRDLDAAAHVWYADKSVHNGNGCLRDSDAALALDNYVYEPERGMYASANIPALVGKPYPLHNWCVAFYLPVGYAYNG